MKHTARVRLEPHTGTVEIDGAPLRSVRAVTISGSVTDLPRLTVELLLHEVEVDGDMLVTVPPRTAESLVALGWTPPEGQGVGG
jgi:hypothetical protein